MMFPMMYGYGWDGSWGWIGMIFMVFWWALLVIGLVYLIKWLVKVSSESKTRGEKSALEILKERYARGEINSKEFEEMKRRLME